MSSERIHSSFINIHALRTNTKKGAATHATAPYKSIHLNIIMLTSAAFTVYSAGACIFKDFSAIVYNIFFPVKDNLPVLGD